MQKRIMSLILVVCMMITLLPSVNVAAQSVYSDYSITYDFTKLTGVEGKPPIAEITREQTYGFWEPGYMQMGANPTKESYGISGDIGDRWFSVKINVPAAGKYKTNLTFLSAARGGTAGIYILDSETATSAAAIESAIGTVATPVTTYRIGQVNFESATSVRGNVTGVGEIPALSDVTFDEPGEYVLVFRAEAKGTKSYAMYPTAFTLEGKGEKALTSIFLKNTKISVGTGEACEIELVSARLSDYTAVSDISTLALSYSGYNSDVIDVSNEGVITAKKEGNTEITVTAELEGLSAKATVSVEVTNIVFSDYSLKYVFTNTVGTKRIDEEMTDGLTKGFWSWADSNKRISTLNSMQNFAQLGTYQNDWVALKLNVPVAGTYKTDFTYSVTASNHAGAGLGKIYVLPGNTADIPATVKSSKPLGEVDFKGTGNSLEYGKKATLSNVTFPTSGEYYLVFSALGYNDRPHNMLINEIRFIGGEKRALMSVFADKSELVFETGNTDTISLSDAYLSDYSEATGYSLSYESSDEGVARVSDEGIVTALAEGKAEITITATLDGVSTSDTVDVLVLPVGASKYIAVYDFETDGNFEETTFADTNNFWQFSGAEEGYCAIEINIPAAGKYSVDVGEWSGSVRFGKTAEEASEAVQTAYFPEKGAYIAVFESEGNEKIPKKLTLRGGTKKAIMDVGLELSGSIVRAASAVLSDGSRADVADAKITYGIYDFEVASINKTTGKILPGKTDGTATVFADIVLDNEAGHGELSVNVKGEDLEASGVSAIYTFNAASEEWKSENQSSYEEKYGITQWSVVDIPYAHSSGNWAWHDASRDDLIASSTMWSSSGSVSFKPKKNEWVAFKIRIPAAGRYWATFSSPKRAASSQGCAGIYFVPVGDRDAINALLTPEELEGEVNTLYKASDAWIYIEDEIGDVYFPTNGEYLVVFRGITDSKIFNTKTLTLDGTNSIKSLKFDIAESELNVGDTVRASLGARLLDGTALEDDEVTYVYSSDNEDAVIFEDGEIRAVGDGTANVTVLAIYGQNSVSETRKITVTEITAPEKLLLYCVDSGYVGKSISLTSKLQYASNSTKLIDNKNITYTVLSGDAVVSDGKLTAGSAGDITLQASYKHSDGEIYYSEPVVIKIQEGTYKSESTYYTETRRKYARENISKYSWAKSYADGLINTCDKYLDNIETLYESIFYEGLPRGYILTLAKDLEYMYCRYCGTNIEGEYGGITIDLYRRPWKIQCPACKRIFPSNDFESFYKLGLDRKGQFDRQRALDAHRAMLLDKGLIDTSVSAPGERYSDSWYKYYGYGVKGGFLYNESFTELWKDKNASTYNVDPRTKDVVDGLRWGVDDGFGYVPGRENNGVPEVHNYIACYIYDAHYEVSRAINNLSLAYVFTDEIEYARGAAKLLDRMADVYPSLDTRVHYYFNNTEYAYPTTGGGNKWGKVLGNISDNRLAIQFVLAADALFPMLNDEKLVEELSETAEKLGLENPKTSGDLIWQNWEKGILLESFEGVQDNSLCGNYGYAQKLCAAAALVLDSQPQSSVMIDWLFADGPANDTELFLKEREAQGITSNEALYDVHLWGGNLLQQIAKVIDRDGHPEESSPTYNIGWINVLYPAAEYLYMYDKNDKRSNLYANPKFAKMFVSCIPLILADSHTAHIADSTELCATSFVDTEEMLIEGFKYLKNTELGNELAEALYRRNGYSAEGLHYPIFEENPERLEEEILERIDDDTTLKSEALMGYGFYVLRDGSIMGDKNLPTYTNNMRDFWIYTGRNGDWSHSHHDALNLGLEAFGLNMAPDFGYPEKSGKTANRYQWVRPTINHNTVTVNEKNQIPQGRQGTPLHFDDSGTVKLIDVDSSKAYAETSIYRRTVVMVNAGADVSYGIDFFRVKGGDDHIYSFHSQSDEIYAIEGIEAASIEHQVDSNGHYVGTYAGPDVEFGNDPSGEVGDTPSKLAYPVGYTWMKNVRRARHVSDFSVDFKVTDFKKVLPERKNLHLRLTMLNDENAPLSEVAFTSGYVLQKESTKDLPETFEYVLARRNGENLDTLYTAVYEPYKNERYLSDIVSVDITVSDDSEAQEGRDDVAKAVKVVHSDKDRIDYVVYATNNDVTYTITDGDVSFSFRGFVGVYSINSDGLNTYSYVHDGDIIGSDYEKREYTGKIADFTMEPSLANYITIKSNDEIDCNEITGKYIYVSNDNVENAVYKIESAEHIDGGVKLNIGTITTIRGYKDNSDLNRGYTYNIAKNQNARIPLSHIEGYAPVFDSINENLSASAGSSIGVQVKAAAQEGTTIEKYIGTTLPRGASVNSSTGVVSWKPDASQVGKNVFAITARDSVGRESTVYFTVTVYGSTTGDKNAEDEGSGKENNATSAGGGGGGGGGAAPAPDTGDETNTDQTDTSDESLPLEGKVPNKGEADEVEKPLFTDLGNHAWARDAITSLAKTGIIKGTTASTFSPAANITRADFALLLVRAFNLTSDNSENFADVAASDYFAGELAIARNAGIVAGIGDNKYAPRNTITRQDMMVIVYRALRALGIELEAGEAACPDFDEVAPYARDAVSALIGTGLVNGKSGKIAPTDYTTRAEVAVLIKRILDFVK